MKKTILSAALGLLLTAPVTFGVLLLEPITTEPIGRRVADSDGSAAFAPSVASPAAVDPNSHIYLYASGSMSQTSLEVTLGGTFSLDTYIQFTGYTAVGLSYWLEVQSALAPFLTLTSETYFQNWTPIQAGTNTPFDYTANGVDSGYTRETRDLGSTSPCTGGPPCTFTEARTDGTYQVSTLNFSVGASAPTGIYTLQLTTLSPVSSIITERSGNQFIDHQVATSQFILTVVPEPATLSLLGLGGLGSLGLTLLRARRKG